MTIREILDRYPHWPQFVIPEPGYLKVAENGNMRFVLASTPGFYSGFKDDCDEILDAMDDAELGKEVVVLLEGSAIEPEDENWDFGEFWLYYEVVDLPIPLPVDDD